MEEWRQIRDYPDYAISSMGRIKRTRPYSGQGKPVSAGHVLATYFSVKNGKPLYRKVQLRGNGLKKTQNVHDLVAKAFLGPRPPGQEVNHKDGDKSNAEAGNLEYVTRAGNRQHARSHGLWAPHSVRLDLRGMANPRCKLSDPQVCEIRTLSGDGVKAAEISKSFGISVQHTYRIIKGQRRVNIDTAPP